MYRLKSLVWYLRMIMYFYFWWMLGTFRYELNEDRSVLCLDVLRCCMSDTGEAKRDPEETSGEGAREAVYSFEFEVARGDGVVLNGKEVPFKQHLAITVRPLAQ